MIYEYKCRVCHTPHTSTAYGREGSRCFAGECTGTLKRVYSFTTLRPMAEHFNATVGKPISSNRQFDEALKVKSAEMTDRLGFEQRYVRIEPEQAGATQEGMEATYREQVATGQRETKLIL